MLTMSRQSKHEFMNSKGEKLVGILVEPSSVGKDWSDVVIMAHGYMSTKNSCRFPEIASALADNGMSTFRFDHPCAIGGESERKGPFLMGNHEDETQDIKSAADYMRSTGRRVCGLIGHSKGGTNTIKYCADIGDIPKALCLAPRFRPQDGLESRFGKGILDELTRHPEGIPRKEPFGFEWVMRKEDFEGRLRLPMVDYAAKIKTEGKVQIRVLHGKDDTTIPYQESIQCSEILGNEPILIAGDHNFTKSDDGKEMVKRVAAYFSAST